MYLSGCIQVDNSSLVAIAKGMPLLTVLDISRCPAVTDGGVRALALRSDRLRELSFADHEKLPVAVLEALAQGCTNLRTLDLTGCKLVTESSVRQLVYAMSRVTELRLNNCVRVSRPFMKTLADELPFVQLAYEFFGLVGLPDCDARIYLTELRRAQLIAIVPIQRIVRGVLARKRVAALWTARYRRQAASTIQRVWLGYVDRQKVRQFVKELTHEEASIMIQSCMRGWLGRLKVRRLKWRRLMAARRARAATTMQACFKRYQARCVYHRLCDAKFLREQEHRRMEALRQKSAKIMQGAWLIYRARCRVMAIKEALQRERALQQRRKRAATEIQRIVRGLQARRLRARLQEFLREMLRQLKACLYVQTSARKFIARREAARRRMARNLKLRWEAAIKIQKAYRGSRGRHIFAIITSLHSLRRVENAAATRIQVATCWLIAHPLLLAAGVAGIAYRNESRYPVALVGGLHHAGRRRHVMTVFCVCWLFGVGAV